MSSGWLSYGVLVLLLVASTTRATGFTEHSVVEKSFVQAQQECVEYLHIPKHRLYQYLNYNFPNDAQTKCMIRCVGLNLKWWDADGVLRPSVIAQYFLPDGTDEENQERTYACILRRTAPEEGGSCRQAFHIFQCYLEQFGELLNCPKLVPLEDTQLAEAVHFCLGVVEVSLGEFRHYTTEGNFLDTDASRCLLRCIVIRTGVYSDLHGPFQPRYELQFGSPTLWNDLQADVCAIRLRREGLEECTLAARAVYECYDFGGTLQPALWRALDLLQAQEDALEATLTFVPMREWWRYDDDDDEDENEDEHDVLVKVGKGKEMTVCRMADSLVEIATPTVAEKRTWKDTGGYRAIGNADGNSLVAGMVKRWK
uniref:Odorant-binding protein n=1 Tax=Anopheles atroparvus TaxID=41427 RepID=A0A182IW37_ANOAO